jgi:dCMP deaminase
MPSEKYLSPELLARIKEGETNYLPPTWDMLYMRMVYLIASKSKDTKTKIGAVIVGPHNEPISFGFNGMPRGVDDHKPERYCRPMKYSFFEHAERNSIYTLPRIGAFLPKGSKMYTSGTPCSDCGRAIIQAGLTEVIVHQPFELISQYLYDTWKESCEATTSMFQEAGVSLRMFEEFVDMNGYVDGKLIEV